MSAKRAAAWLGGVIGALAIACAPAYGAQARDPCTFLTPNQVGAVLGARVGAGGHPAKATCRWAVSSGRRAPGARHVDLLVMPGFMYDLVKSGLRHATEAVGGIGDGAFYNAPPGTPPGLVFKQGSSAYIVRIYGLPGEQAETREKTLAREILSAP